jgi:DNA-binding CsgD family transcriptional regulator
VWHDCSSVTHVERRRDGTSRTLRDRLTVAEHQSAVIGDDPVQRVMAHALATMTAGVPATRAWMWPVDHRGLMLDRVVMLTRGSQPETPADREAQDYRERYWVDDPFAPHRFVDRRRLVVAVDDIGGPQALAATRFGQHFLAESGFAHRVVIHVRDAGRLVATGALLRTGAEPPFSPREVAFLQRVQPLVESAYVGALHTEPELDHEELLRQGGLGRRQTEVARLAAAGRTNAEIGHALSISGETVKRHLSTVYRRLGVRSRTELSSRLGPAARGDAREALTPTTPSTPAAAPSGRRPAGPGGPAGSGR